MSVVAQRSSLPQDGRQVVPHDLVSRFRASQTRVADARRRSADATVEARRLCAQALSIRMSTRPWTHFAHVRGEVDGSLMAALVRQDGSAVGPAPWIRLADLPRNQATRGVGWREPLRTTLSLTRSCDRLVGLELVDVGGPNRPFAGDLQARHVGRWLPEPLSIEVLEGRGVHHVRLSGEIDIAVVDRLETQLVDVAGSTVVVDLSDVTFLDARGLSALLSARRRVLDAGHDFHLRGAQGIVRRVFDLTGMQGLLDPDPVSGAESDMGGLRRT